MKPRALYARISGSLLSAVASVTLLAGLANQPEDVGYIHPLPSPDPVAELIHAHGCWRHDDPVPSDMVGKFPTHAIVNGKHVGRHMTDLAFDQEIGHHPHGVTVNAFCR